MAERTVLTSTPPSLEASSPEISFVLPAHNEAQLLPGVLQALQAAAREVGRPYEVIVVNDASTDATAEVARDAGVRVIDVQHRQIAATRNSGGRAARGEVVFFIDADTFANAPAIREALAALEQGAVGGGCVYNFDRPLPLWGRGLLAVGNALGRRLRIVGGAFLFCRRSAFDDVGGFDERLYASEELTFVRALKRQGRVVVPGAMVTTSGRKLAVLTFSQSLRLLARFLLQRGRFARSRDGLDVWCGPEAQQARNSESGAPVDVPPQDAERREGAPSASRCGPIR